MSAKLQRTANNKILLVEPLPGLNRLYRSSLEDKNYQIKAVSSGQEALNILKETSFNLIILELDLPDIEGINVLKKLKGQQYNIPVIVTGQGSVNTAIEVIRNGAHDFLIKPFNTDRLVQTAEKVLGHQQNETQNLSIKPCIAGKPVIDETCEKRTPLKQKKAIKGNGFSSFIGTSPAMLSVYEKIEKAAKSDANVFITGQSGTGKEICAEAIHKHSDRKDRPFVPVNCAALPRDLIEAELFGHVKGAFTGAVSDREGAAKMANGGTLFLDEIAEMKPDMQTKLLRFVQTLCFQKIGSDKIEKTDIRIICATNRDPLHEIECGSFREDLYYRLHVIPIHMPPLCERNNDILDITKAQLLHYAALENKNFTDINDDAAYLLCQYHWPGNIRQLQNIIRHSVIMNDGPLLTANMLPAFLLPKRGSFAMDKENYNKKEQTDPVFEPRTSQSHEFPETGSLADIEQKAIIAAIRACNGNIPQAAAKLKISPSTIYRKKAEWKKHCKTEKNEHNLLSGENIFQNTLSTSEYYQT